MNRNHGGLLYKQKKQQREGYITHIPLSPPSDRDFKRIYQ